MAKKSKPNYLAILSIIAGVLVIAFPDLLRWIIGLYLIIWGIMEIKG